MIEGMAKLVRQRLPLRISKIRWDGTSFHMHGKGWGFYTLSAWRVSTQNRVLFGCNDKGSKKLVHSLKNLEIIDLDIQDHILKIDPVFILSNGQKIEIFSTDTYEPWFFDVDDLAFFVPTPAVPSAFDVSDLILKNRKIRMRKDKDKSSCKIAIIEASIFKKDLALSQSTNS